MCGFTLWTIEMPAEDVVVEQGEFIVVPED
jgi:hypothetical protein